MLAGFAFAKAQAGAHWLRKANKATLLRRRLWNTFGVQMNLTRACSYDFLVLKMFNKRSHDKFTIRIPFNILKVIATRHNSHIPASPG